MPVYYFHLETGEKRVSDCDGTELKGVSQAIDHATTVALELGRNARPAELNDQQIVVIDDSGNEVFRVPLSSEWSLASPPHQQSL